MKIERKLDGELVLFITENEFKNAFKSKEKYLRFRDEIISLIKVFHELDNEINK